MATQNTKHNRLRFSRLNPVNLNVNVNVNVKSILPNMTMLLLPS